MPWSACRNCQATHSGGEAELPRQVFTRSQSLYPSSQDGTHESILGHHGVLTSRPLDNAQGILRWILWLCVWWNAETSICTVYVYGQF